MANNPDLKYEELNLNFCNWQLGLNLEEMERFLRPLVEKAKFHQFDVFRLELSGWYYKNW